MKQSEREALIRHAGLNVEDVPVNLIRKKNAGLGDPGQPEIEFMPDDKVEAKYTKEQKEWISASILAPDEWPGAKNGEDGTYTVKFTKPFLPEYGGDIGHKAEEAFHKLYPHIRLERLANVVIQVIWSLAANCLVQVLYEAPRAKQIIVILITDTLGTIVLGSIFELFHNPVLPCPSFLVSSNSLTRSRPWVPRSGLGFSFGAPTNRRRSMCVLAALPSALIGESRSGNISTGVNGFPSSRSLSLSFT